MALGLFSSDSEYELVLESYDDFAYLYGVTAQIPIIGKRFQWNAGDAYAAISLNPEFNISPRKFMAEGYDTISYPIEISEFAISVPVLFRAEFVGIVNWGDIVLWGVYVDAGLQMDFPLNPEWRRYGRYDDPKKPFEGRAGMDLGIPFGIGVSAGGLRYRLNAGIRMISYFTKYSKESGAWFGMGPQLQLWF